MSNVVSLSPATSDVSIRGAAATPEYGPGATYFYKGHTESLTAEVIANKFQTIFQNADNYRKTFIPEMLTAYAQYNGEPQRQGKEPWQADIHVPLPAQAIDIATGRMYEAIFNDEDFFEVDPDRDQDTLLTEFAQHGTKWQIAKGRGKFDIKMSMKDALICGFGPLKIHYEASLEPYTETVWRPGAVGPNQMVSSLGDYVFKSSERVIRRMRFESMIPTDGWLDPTGKNRYFIARSTRAVSDLWPLTQDLKDADGAIVRKAVYDSRQVARVQPGMRDSQRVMDASRIRRDMPAPFGTSYDQTVDVYELWGDFIDPDNGVTLFRNIVATFVDKRICIRYPQRNPFRHGKVPIVVFQSKLLPHQVYGYGLLQQNSRLSTAIDQHANIMQDKATLQVPTLEYDGSASKDPAIQGGSRPKFSPGKMWPRKPGPDKRIFYPVEGFQPIGQEDISWMQMLMNWYQMSSTVPEVEGGQQLSNNRKTKGEMELRAAAAQQNFNDAAVHIQEQAIGPLLRLTYLTMVQYEDEYDVDELTRMFGDDPKAQLFIKSLGEMSDAERWHNLYLDSEFRAVGITNATTRQRQLQQTADFVRVVSADPLLSMFIDKQEQLREMLPLFQQKTRMILDNAAAMIQMAQLGQIQQMFGGMMGQPGQPGAPAGPPGLGPSAAPGGMPLGGQDGPGNPHAANPHNSLAAVAGEAGRTT